MEENCVECQGCVDNSAPVMPPQNTTGPDCSQNNPCSSVSLADCVIYNGDDIDCGNDTVVAKGSTLAQALRNIVAYFCGRLSVLFPIDIQGSGNVTVTSVQDPETGEIVYTVEGNNVKFVKEITTNFTGNIDTISFTDDEITACGITPTGCGEPTLIASDFHVQLWYNTEGEDVWKIMQPYSAPTQYWSGEYDPITQTFSANMVFPESIPDIRVRLVAIY
jgi:hypothetical protein